MKREGTPLEEASGPGHGHNPRTVPPQMWTNVWSSWMSVITINSVRTLQVATTAAAPGGTANKAVAFLA